MATDIASVVADGYMEYAMILDQKYNLIAVIDVFESFVWIDRYDKAGEFTLDIPVWEQFLPHIRINNYVAIRESDRLMVIENVELITDAENGDKLSVTGRSLESILARRVVWQNFEFGGPVQNVLSTVLSMNAISPGDTKRQIPGLRFETNNDPAVNANVDTMKMLGENVYSLCEALTSTTNLGFKMLPEGQGGFVFKVYAGVDRSWSQTENLPVVFSHSYENLLDSNYLQSEVLYVSNALVRGDDDSITMEVMRHQERTGLARREMFIDTNLQPEEQELIHYSVKVDENGNQIKDEEGNPEVDEITERIKIYDMAYYNRMFLEAKVEMANHKVTEVFDSEVDTYHQFIYGRDYDIGDIVQVQNRYGYEGRCRVTEVMRTRDASGPKMVPTFIMVDESGNEVQKVNV